MNIVTTLHFRTISIVTIAFLVLHSAKYTLGQLDSNVNTLRYDGEVNIGKICIICYFIFLNPPILLKEYVIDVYYIFSKNKIGNVTIWIT